MGGVELGAGPADDLVSVLGAAPPAGDELSTCKDKTPSVLLLFNYQRHADVDVAVVDFGCPSSRSSSPAASSAVAFFGQDSRAIDPGLDSTLVADAGSYSVRRSPITPDVFGETAAQATKTASAHGFALAFGGEEVDRLYAPGTVLLQFPPAGMSDLGNQVDVILSAPISLPCTAADLDLSYEGYQGAAGSYAASFLVRNVSASSCLLAGPMKLTGTEKSGHRMTGTAEFTAPAGSVLSAGAAPWPAGSSPSVGEVFGTLAVSSPDYCPGRTVVPALWSFSTSGGTLSVANSLRGKAFPTCGGALSPFGTFSID